MRRLSIIFACLLIFAVSTNAQNIGTGINIEVPIPIDVVKLLPVDSLVFYSRLAAVDTAINQMSNILHFSDGGSGIAVVAGQIGNCLTFDGTADSLISPYAATWNVNTGSFTWNMWFKHGALTAEKYFIDRIDKSGSGYYVKFNADSTISFVISDDDNVTNDSVTTTSQYADDNWHFLAVVLDTDRDEMWIYVDWDSTKITQTNAVGDLDGDGDQVTRIGVNTGNTKFYGGDIDEAMFWRGEALSLTDLDFMYQLGKADDFSPPYIFEWIYVDSLFARTDTIYIKSPMQSDSSLTIREIFTDSVQADTGRFKYVEISEQLAGETDLNVNSDALGDVKLFGGAGSIANTVDGRHLILYRNETGQVDSLEFYIDKYGDVYIKNSADGRINIVAGDVIRLNAGDGKIEFFDGGVLSFSIDANVGAKDQLLFQIYDLAGNQMVIGNKFRDYDHPLQTNPTVYFQSNGDPDISNNYWGSVHHDSSGLVITTGPGIGEGTEPDTIPNYIIFAPRGIEGIRVDSSKVTIKDSTFIEKPLDVAELLTSDSVIVNDLTASRTVVTNASKKLTSSAVTATELLNLDNSTSELQAQINLKMARAATRDSIIQVIQDSSLINQTELTAQLKDSVATHDEANEIIDLSDSLTAHDALHDEVSEITGVMAMADMEDSVKAIVLDLDSLNLKIPLPHKDIAFGDWVAYPDFVPDLVDTVQVSADLDTINSGLFHIIEGEFPDTSTVLSVIHVWSPIFDVPVWAYGLDSVVLDAITGVNSIDSNYVKLVLLADDGAGATTFLDSTVSLTNAATWTHDATITTTSALIKYSKFRFYVELASIADFCYAKLGRLKLYYKVKK